MSYVKHRTSRILAGLLIGICAGMVGLFVFIHVRQNAKDKIEVVLQRLAKHPTIPVKVQRWQLGLTSVKFENISVGKENEAVISRIDASINLSPFAGEFGKLKTLTVDRVRIKTQTTSPFELVRQIQRQLAEKDPVSKRETNKPATKLFERLPFSDRLHIKSGGLRFVDSFGREHLRVRGLAVLIQRQEQKAHFRVGSLSSPDGVLERNLEAHLAVAGNKDGYEFWLGSKSQTTTAWSINVRLTDALDQFGIQVDARTLPRFLEPYLRDYLASPEALQSSAKITARKSEEAGWSFGVDAKVWSVRMAHKLVSRRVVGPFAVQMGAKGNWLPDEDLINFEKGHVTFVSRRQKKSAALKVLFSGGSRLSRQDESREVFGVMRIPTTGCQTLVDAPPLHFAPDIQEMELAGSFEGAMEFNFPLQRPQDFFYRILDSKFNCNVTAAPYAYRSQHLERGFTVNKTYQDRNIEIAIDPLSDSYSPKSAIAEHVTKAFVTSEDASFWQHDGIDGNAIEAAFRRNLGEGQVAMGGSTITMQTVKNLFLSHERTLSRKYQELLLAWHMNRILSKDRILEIYMNLVEFGPGLYGITDAAEHYFAKHPFDLTLKESAFLANMLPSPVRRYRHFCAGQATAEFDEMMDRLLRRMLNLRRIGYSAYAHAIRSPLQFNNETRAKSAHCSGTHALSADGAG